MLISIQVSLTEEILIDFGVKSSTSLYIIWAQVIDDFCQLSSRLQKIFFFKYSHFGSLNEFFTDSSRACKFSEY